MSKLTSQTTLLQQMGCAQRALHSGEPDLAHRAYCQMADQLAENVRLGRGAYQQQQYHYLQDVLHHIQQLEQAETGSLEKQSEVRGFARLVGMSAEKKLLTRKVIMPLQHTQAARLYQRSPGGGVLLYGPSGTGKTFLVKALAEELNAPFFHIRQHETLDKYVGGSEKALSTCIADARRHPLSVIFIDELDWLGKSRDEGSHESSGRLLNHLLEEMDGLGNDQGGNLLWIAATNYPWRQDAALLRPGRFGTHLYLGLPDMAVREALFRHCLQSVPCEEVDFSQLAQQAQGYSMAEIQECCDLAMDQAFEQYVTLPLDAVNKAGGAKNQVPITQTMLAQALADLVSSCVSP